MQVRSKHAHTRVGCISRCVECKDTVQNTPILPRILANFDVFRLSLARVVPYFAPLCFQCEAHMCSLLLRKNTQFHASEVITYMKEHADTRIRMYSCTHAHPIYEHIHTYIHTYIPRHEMDEKSEKDCTHAHARTCTHIYRPKHACTCTCTHAKHKRTCIRERTYANTLTKKYTNVCKQTHKHNRE